MIERSFNYKKSNSFETDFYPLIEKSNHNNLYVITDHNDNLIAHIGTRPKILTYNNFKIPVCFIGGLATNPLFRGKGIFSLFFKQLLSELSNSFGLFILWGDLNNFYEKFNFFETGIQIQTGLKTIRDYTGSFEKHDLKELSDEEINTLNEIYYDFTSRFIKTKRTAKDWRDIEYIDSTNLYVKKTDQKIVGYFFVNKGHDLTDIIHEFGCFKQYTNECITELKDYKLWIPHPNYIIDINSLNNPIIMYSSMMKIGNRKILSSFINNLTNSSINLDNKTPPDLWGPEISDDFKSYNIPSVFISGIDSI